ncbi:MAG: hypothetical protein HQM06_17835 [Magnetococcales bacterium]|nr:hypothetical protein [Magnetococcales bacterium]
MKKQPHHSKDEVLGDVPSSDYLEYFFLRERHSGTVVTQADPVNPADAAAGTMLAHQRGPQLFKVGTIDGVSNWVSLINQNSSMVLDIVLLTTPVGPDLVPCLILNNQNPASLSQQWSVSATNQLLNAAYPNMTLQLGGPLIPGYIMGSPTQQANEQFEMLYPADFVYIRHCATGWYLSAPSNPGQQVMWGTIDTGNPDFKQWGVTSDGNLVNRGASGNVLSLASDPPTVGSSLFLSNPADPTSQGGLVQQFNVTDPRGGISSVLDSNLVIDMGPSGLAFINTYSSTNVGQLVELISPFQFFSLECGCWINGQQPWFIRQGNAGATAFSVSDQPNELFTVSRYGQIFSMQDSNILQFSGIGNDPAFVVGGTLPLGGPNTTFLYSEAASSQAGYGKISLASNQALGLITYGGTPPSPQFYWTGSPTSGNQVWQLVGQANGFFQEYQALARQYFCNPSPAPVSQLHPEVVAAVAQLDKTTKVIITLIAGVLDIATGISVGSVTDAVAAQVAQICLGEATVAAKIAVLMQGTVTAASVIAVADGITKAGLWWQILQLLLPNSFWSWAITIAKLGLMIAAWVLGTPWAAAVTGAKIALLVADIINIIAGDLEKVAKESAILADLVLHHPAKALAAE